MRHFLIGCLIGFFIIAVMWETCRISFAIGFVQGYRASESGCLDQAQPNTSVLSADKPGRMVPLAGGDNNKSQLGPTVQRPLVLPIRL